MSNPTTVFIPKPVSEPPKENNNYFVFRDALEISIVDTGHFENGKWDEHHPNPLGLISWLQPIQITEESQIQKAIDYFKYYNNIEFNREDVIDCLQNTFLEPDLARSCLIRDQQMGIEAQRIALEQLEERVKQLEQERVKIASDAWDAAEKHMTQYVDTPDKETYLNQFK